MRFKARMAATMLGIVGLALAAGDARAMMLRDTNLVDLIRQSDSIVLGNVAKVTDGIDERGLTYTEVTVTNSERLRGDEEGTLTFRQFGLRTARPSSDGTRMILAAPEGMPRYTEGEEVLLFMNPGASITGLRSPVGLGNGKFAFGPGTASNALGNQGVFTNISVERGITTANDDRILATTMGAVNDTDQVARPPCRQGPVGRDVPDVEHRRGQDLPQQPSEEVHRRPQARDDHRFRFWDHRHRWHSDLRPEVREEPKP